MTEAADKLRDLVADVAAAYFSNSKVVAREIPRVIGQIASSLGAIGAPLATEKENPPEVDTPRATAVEIRKSIRPDGLVSFEDGKTYKTLRRHLSTRGLTPEQYRAKWGLPRDYPIVSANYSAARSAMAKTLGLGRSRKRAAAAPETVPGEPMAPEAMLEDTAPETTAPKTRVLKARPPKVKISMVPAKTRGRPK